MPKGLRRWYGGGDLHFITSSCYERRPFLGSAARRDLFLKIFEEVRIPGGRLRGDAGAYTPAHRRAG